MDWQTGFRQRNPDGWGDGFAVGIIIAAIVVACVIWWLGP